MATSIYGVSHFRVSCVVLKLPKRVSMSPKLQEKDIICIRFSPYKVIVVCSFAGRSVGITWLIETASVLPIKKNRKKFICKKI